MKHPPTAVEYDSNGWEDHCSTDNLIRIYETIGWNGYRRNNLHDIKEAIEDQAGSPTVLDVGCFVGMYSQPLADAGAEYTGVDVTPKFIEEAKRRNPEAAFQVADARSLPFEDGSFDIVFCGGVLQHLAEPEAVSRELWRVAKKTILLEANTQDVEAPYKDVSQPGFIDVWYNRYYLDRLFGSLGGKMRYVRSTARYPYGFYSSLWRIDK